MGNSYASSVKCGVAKILGKQICIYRCCKSPEMYYYRIKGVRVTLILELVFHVASK